MPTMGAKRHTAESLKAQIAHLGETLGPRPPTSTDFIALARVSGSTLAKYGGWRALTAAAKPPADPLVVHREKRERADRVRKQSKVTKRLEPELEANEQRHDLIDALKALGGTEGPTDILAARSREGLGRVRGVRIWIPEIGLMGPA